MRDRQNAVLDALQRAQRFLDENSALLTGVGPLLGAWVERGTLHADETAAR